MKQGVLLPHRVRLLLSKGHSCYRPRRTGERKRKSVRGCIVAQVRLFVLYRVIVFVLYRVIICTLLTYRICSLSSYCIARICTLSIMPYLYTMDLYHSQKFTI